jgi:MFS family permease
MSQSITLAVRPANAVSVRPSSSRLPPATPAPPHRSRRRCRLLLRRGCSLVRSCRWSIRTSSTSPFPTTRELGSPLAAAQWVVSGYLLALAAMLTASAFVAKRFGTRRVYLASLFGFTVSSGFCALAPNVKVLIALRALQGATGAPLVPLAMSMLLGLGGTARKIPPANGIVLFLTPALGPTGDLLIPLAGWPAIFLMNVPVGIVSSTGASTARESPT